MTQYPGSPDPDDPFAKPPNEDGAGSTPGSTSEGTSGGTEETAPIRPEEPGYWEKLAQEQASQQGGTPPPPPSYQQNPTSAQPAGDQNPWAGYGEPSGSPYGSPPPPPAYGAPAAPGYGAPATPYGYGPTGYAGGYAPQQSHPQSTTALVLGLIGLVGGCLCYLPLLVAPFAWWIGAKAKREIAASNGQLGGQGNAQAGFVMGIIGSVLLVLGVLGLALIIILGVTGNLDDSSSYSGYSSYSSDF